MTRWKFKRENVTIDKHVRFILNDEGGVSYDF